VTQAIPYTTPLAKQQAPPALHAWVPPSQVWRDRTFFLPYRILRMTAKVWPGSVRRGRADPKRCAQPRVCGRPTASLTKAPAEQPSVRKYSTDTHVPQGVSEFSKAYLKVPGQTVVHPVRVHNRRGPCQDRRETCPTGAAVHCRGTPCGCPGRITGIRAGARPAPNQRYGVLEDHALQVPNPRHLSRKPTVPLLPSPCHHPAAEGLDGIARSCYDFGGQQLSTRCF